MTPANASASTEEATHEAVSAVRLGLWVSAARCLLTYVVAPAVGALGVVLGPLGLILQLLGTITAISGARRLWRMHHRARYAYAVVAATLTAAGLYTLVQSVVRVAR